MRRTISKLGLCGFLLFGSLEANSDTDVCSFYAQQLEAKLQCGSDGYPLAYGQKYCARFRDLSGLSAAGKRWRDKTLACLQSKLSTFAQSGGSCDAARQTAFDSHAPCYIASGFCDLPTGDWIQIFHIIDWSDLLSSGGLKQIGAALKKCYDDRVHKNELDPNSDEGKQIQLIISALNSGQSPAT